MLILESCNQTGNGMLNSDLIDTTDLSSGLDTPTTYWQLDFDTITVEQKVRIENEFYDLTIKSYSLNDSSISRINDYDKSKAIYHDYETEILLTLESDTVLQSTLTKETFSDSLSGDFYKYAVLHNIEYSSIRTNRLYFKAFLNVPDTDWGTRPKFAIFFRTSKKGQINYWNFNSDE